MRKIHESTLPEESSGIRVPPSDLDGEAVVLSASILGGRDVIQQLRPILEPKHFYADANRRIYEALLELADGSGPIDSVAVARLLRVSGHLVGVGGTPYIAQLTDATPATANVLAHAQAVRDAARKRAAADLGHRLVAEAQGDTGPTGEWLAGIADQIGSLLEPGDQGPSRSILDERWIELSAALHLVTDEPPAQRWLLRRAHGGRDHGVLPRGKTGMLTSAGGLGKTYALIQLAIAQASAGFWLDTFRAVESGHVLLALAEEDADELRRRLWRALNALELDLDARKEIANRIHLLPLHGVPVALTMSTPAGTVIETEFAQQLRAKLNAVDFDWSLVILDPLSRWGGDGTETSNGAATRFVQVVESLTGVRGAPTVLVAHHSSDASVQLGKSNSRGVTGIEAGFRWRASLDAITNDSGEDLGVRLSNPKSNYSLKFKPLVLIRNTEPGIEGTLRLATDGESEELRDYLPRGKGTAEQREKAKTSAKQSKFESECQAVLSCLPEAPAFLSRSELLGSLATKGLTWSQHTLEPKLAELIRQGSVVDLSGGGKNRARQYCKPAGGEA